MKKVLSFLVFSLLISGMAWAQSTISGRVTDKATGLPMEGVTILLAGTTQGVLTDAAGAYSLEVPAEVKELVVSYINYKPLTIEMTGQTSLDIQLEEDLLQLDEVVVTALGVSREKKSLGYSIQDVDGSELVNSGEVNVVQSLSGKAAGIQVVGSSGTPGASSKILIRGASTFTGENQPLFVVDGVPIDNSTDQSEGEDYPFNDNLQGVNNSNRAIDINPDDIESVSILKGPAAAALYGVRAGNGAIIITTKRGKAGRTTVNFRSTLEISQVNKMPELQDEWAQGNYNADGVPVFNTFDPGPDNLYGTADDVSAGTSASWGPKISDSTNLQAYDNVGDFFQNAVSSSSNLSVAGGTENASFRLSLGFLDQTGVVPNTSFNRASIRLASDVKVNDQIKVGATIGYINSGGNRAQNGSNLSGVMLTLSRTPASFNLAGTGEEGYLYPNGQQRQYFFVYDNPYFTAYKNPFTDQVDRLMGNIYAEYKPLDWLSVTYRLGTDTYTDQRNQIWALGAWNPANAPLGEIWDNTLRSRELYSDLLVRAKYDFTDDLTAELTLGNNLWEKYTQNLFSRGRNISIPGFYNYSNTNDLYVSEVEETQRTAAFFFDANVSFKEMLYLQLTGRNEWASTFGPAKDNFFYPAANLSFVFSELIPDNEILSFGKVRFAIAQAGINPDPYLTRTLYTPPFFTDGFTNGISFPYLAQSGFGFATTLGNANLRPEKVTSTELGFDLRFFLGRLGLDVTLYDQKSEDLLITRPLAGSSGFRFIFGNFGSMRNRGIEAVITGTPVKTDNFSWDIGVNFTRNVNEVLSLADGVEELSIESAFSSIGSFAIVGQPYGALYSTKWERTEDGQLLIDETDGLPIVAAERGNVGNPYPDWLAGIRNTLTYKGFSATALLDIRQGGDVWCGTCARLNRLGRTEASADRERDYVIEGVIENADGTFRANDIAIDAQTYYQNYLGDAGAAVENAVFDGSWIRLREVSLNYRTAINTKFLRSLTVSLSGRNLWLSTDYPGVDPETSLLGAESNVNGFDYFNMPSTKSYMATLSLGF
ncbi:SusC/RagA family TonB-linked outer membrane protein [Pontibacter sp. G13]|uniref:SusC/RagA family TonB-linked outer membrane protein n=1 Tax=Pontibacter sp. G13 TaxID=3074898 RepID=UPI002889C2E5|nr:SusC/RagA family TonB-linked outer membrane protein [Pontibacter sp. G13]WNJ20516.1 SusC/RagA family TonB-linked outer membrane protein [Pontibacter sp. G13]